MEAVAARAELSQAFLTLSTVCQQIAEVLAEFAAELTRAAEREHAATAAYVMALEQVASERTVN